MMERQRPMDVQRSGSGGDHGTTAVRDECYQDYHGKTVLDFPLSDFDVLNQCRERSNEAVYNRNAERPFDGAGRIRNPNMRLVLECITLNDLIQLDDVGDGSIRSILATDSIYGRKKNSCFI